MSTITSPHQILVGRFEMGGKSYKVKLSYPNARNLPEVSRAAAEKAMQSLVQSLQGVNPSEIERISFDGIQMKDGTVREHEGHNWSDFSRRVTTDLNRQMIPWGQQGHQMRFEDPQHWTTDVSFIRPDPLFQRLEKREPHQTFESLPQLQQQQVRKVEEETYRTASRVDRFLMDRGYKTKTNKSTPIGIHLSTKRREDYEYSVQAKGERPGPTYQCRFLKNGLNGLTYLEGGKPHTIESAVTSSVYRESPRLHLGRRYTDEDGISLCYAGRPNTVPKAEELAEMLFLSELDPKTGRGKGIQKLTGKDGKPTYIFTFCVQSLLSSSSVLNKKDYERIIQVMDSLIDLSQREIMIGGHRVRCAPIFFTDQFNAWNRMEYVLPEWLNGREEAEEASSTGNRSIRNYAEETLQRIPAGIRAIQIRDTLEELDQATLPEERVLCRAYLCQLLDIPITYHCQSSVDRTSIAVAVTLAADQWLKTKQPPMVDGKFCITVLLKKEEFKELFAGHIHPGLIVGEYSRGKKGLRFQKGLFKMNRPFVCFQRGT